MMFFNPLFLQSISEAGVQTHAATNKLSNSKYLFSDIIKVFNESELALPGTVLPESTTISSAPQIFSFQSSDISTKVNYEIPKEAEATQDQNILELLSSILLANAAPVESLPQISESSELPETNSEVKPDALSGLKEFVVQSEILPQLLTQLLSADKIDDSFTAKTVTTAETLPAGKNNVEIVISNLLEKLETDGAAVIQLETAGKNIQFTISKIDADQKISDGTTDYSKKDAQSVTTQLMGAETVASTANEMIHAQPSSKEIAKESPDKIEEKIKTVAQNVSGKTDSVSGKTKAILEEIKSRQNTIVVINDNIDSEIDKLILDAATPGHDTGNVNTQFINSNSQSNLVPSEQVGGKIAHTGIESPRTKAEFKPVETQPQMNQVVESPSVENQPRKTEEQSNLTEVQANNIEVQSIKINLHLDKTKVRASKAEVIANKTEVQPGKVEVQTNENDGELKTSETTPIKTALPLVKNYVKVDPQNALVVSENVEPDLQIKKVLNSQLNLNSERVIHALEVESGNVTAPKNLNSYKIVMQVGVEEAKISTPKISVDVVDTKQSLAVSNPVSADEGKNLTSNKPASSYSVKTILDSIKQVLKNEPETNSINVFENKKTNDPTVQSKVEASDINLLNRLAQTNSKLISVSKSEADIKPLVDLHEKTSSTPLKHFVEEKNQTTLDNNQNSFANELANKSDENTFVKKTSTAEAEKEILSLKFAGNADQKVINESRQPEPQVHNHPAQIKGKQEIKVSEAAQVLNEPLIAKSKTENDGKKNSPEVQKISSQNESDKPVVKTLLADKEAGADTHQHQPAQPEVKDVKHDTAKTSPEVDETKSAEIQHNVSTNHHANEIKNSLPKEKISSNNFQLPETVKTIKSFELSEEISKIIESRTSQKVMLRLLPEALGKVKLTLEVGGEVIHAKAEVENESVRQIIQTNTETLKQTLSQNGLQLASFNVSLAGSDEKQQKAHEQKKRSNSFTSKSKIEKQVLPEATRTLGYNTYEYLA